MTTPNGRKFNVENTTIANQIGGKENQKIMEENVELQKMQASQLEEVEKQRKIVEK